MWSDDDVNVLLTCVGRRNYLVEYFRHALDGTGEVLAADASADAPGLAPADRPLLVPSVTDPGYVDVLVDLCRRHDVRLLFSLNDLELPVLAPARERFAAAGTVLAISTPDVVAVCGDKWRTARFLEDHGIATAQTFLRVAEAEAALASGAVRFPLVVKPRWGTASIAVDVVHDLDELKVTMDLTQRRLRRTILVGAAADDPSRPVLVQELLTGDEHGLDVVNDLDGRHVTTFARRKLSMRAGETDRAVTVSDPGLDALGARLGTALGHVGLLDCDVFLGDEPRVLEMNARFGGGYPFSHIAGADVPAALLAWAGGRRPDPAWLVIEPGVRAAKADGVVLVGRDGPVRG